MTELSPPPPQAVIDQRPWWFALIFVLGGTLVIRVLALDMLGALLCALMICLVVVILRDGMRELPKFGLLFGLLCGINFIFYAMPVLSYIISGKTEQHIQPIVTKDYGERYSETHQLSYMLTVKKMPLFDSSKGFVYNAQSVGELLMPVAMLLGTYLGISAHYQFQNHILDILGDDDESISVARAAATHRDYVHTSSRAGNYGAIFGAATGGVPPSSDTHKAHKAFFGASHKLDP